MKNNKIFRYITLGVSLILFNVSCSSDHDTFGVSDVTNYPILELIGNNPTLVKMGTTFTDPGVNATENGVEIDYTTSYKGDYRGASTLDLNVSDRYVATYKATNSDGFSANANRNIYVYNTGDFVNSIEGLYIANVKRTPGQGVVSATADLKYVLIWKNADGTYEVSDAIGGYYEYGRSYGVTYASRGLKLNYTAGLATVAAQPQGVGAFGGNIAVSSVIANPATKTVTINSAWDAGYGFIVTLKQVN